MTRKPNRFPSVDHDLDLAHVGDPCPSIDSHIVIDHATAHTHGSAQMSGHLPQTEDAHTRGHDHDPTTATSTAAMTVATAVTTTGNDAETMTGQTDMTEVTTNGTNPTGLGIIHTEMTESRDIVVGVGRDRHVVAMVASQTGTAVEAGAPTRGARGAQVHRTVTACPDLAHAPLRAFAHAPALSHRFWLSICHISTSRQRLLTVKTTDLSRDSSPWPQVPLQIFAASSRLTLKEPRKMNAE